MPGTSTGPPSLVDSTVSDLARLHGRDDVETDAGEEVMRQMERNLNQALEQPGFEVETFDYYDMDDSGHDLGASVVSFDS